MHPDVRRALMTMRAFNEAARALVMWTALQSDVAHRSGDEKERKSADDHMGLLTPVIKGVLTDQGFANTVMAQQVFGGHGYIAEHGMEQFVRDARIAQIYEGANGIQALGSGGPQARQGRRPRADGLLRRGAGLHQGEGRRRGDEALSWRRSGVALGHLQQAAMWFMQNAMAKPDNAGAGSYDFMHLFGLVALGYMWARIADAALAKSPKANGAGSRYGAKLVTARFFMERMLPETATHLARIQAGAGSMMEVPDEAF